MTIGMLWSELGIVTLREDHHPLLVRAGYMRGREYLLLGQRTLAKIATILRERAMRLSAAASPIYRGWRGLRGGVGLGQRNTGARHQLRCPRWRKLSASRSRQRFPIPQAISSPKNSTLPA